MVAPGFARFVLPVSVIILIGLFAVQAKGTGTIGKVFGPIMIVWFATIALGVVSGLRLYSERRTVMREFRGRTRKTGDVFS